MTARGPVELSALIMIGIGLVCFVAAALLVVFAR